MAHVLLTEDDARIREVVERGLGAPADRRDLHS
jgi:hypothetical protein